MSQSNVKTAPNELPFSGKTISLRKNFSWAFLGNATYAGCQWVVLVIFAKLGTPELVGLFVLGLALAAPIFMLTGLNLRAVQATDAKDDFRFEEYLRVQLLAGVLAFVLTIIVTATAGYGTAIILIAGLIATHKLIESAGDALYGYFQKNEKMNIIAISMIMRGFFNVFFVFIAMLTTGSILMSILTLSFSSILIIYLFDYKKFKQFHGNNGKEIEINIARIKKLVMMSVPLGLVMMANSMNTNVPRYVLEKTFTAHDLGVFAAMAYLVVAGTMVISALGQSASPRLAKYYAAKKYSSFRRVLFILLGAALVLGSLAFVSAKYFGSYILQVLYTEEYARHSNEFVLIMLASGLSFISSVLGYGITATRQFRIQVPITIFSLLVAIVSSVLLIPQGGIQGAAWTTLLIFASQIPLKSYVLFRSLKQV